MEEVKRFQSRALESRYIAIFLDALFFFLRKDTVEKEPILFAMGIRESGEYEYWDSILPPRNPICHIRQ